MSVFSSNDAVHEVFWCQLSSTCLKWFFCRNTIDFRYYAFKMSIYCSYRNVPSIIFPLFPVKFDLYCHIIRLKRFTSTLNDIYYITDWNSVPCSTNAQFQFHRIQNIMYNNPFTTHHPRTYDVFGWHTCPWIPGFAGNSFSFSLGMCSASLFTATCWTLGGVWFTIHLLNLVPFSHFYPNTLTKWD